MYAEIFPESRRNSVNCCYCRLRFDGGPDHSNGGQRPRLCRRDQRLRRPRTQMRRVVNWKTRARRGRDQTRSHGRQRQWLWLKTLSEAIATSADISACAQNSIGISFPWFRLHECRGTGATARFSEARRDSPREGPRLFRPVVTRCRRRPNGDCRCKARIDA